MRLAALALALLGAPWLASCALLTAEKPLFSQADAPAGFVLAEGLWVGKEASCEADPGQHRPGDGSCLEWFEIKRDGDAGWKLDSPKGKEETIYFKTLGAAKPAPRGPAPLVVGEALMRKERQPVYALIVPRGAELPIRRVSVTVISCDDVLRDGDVPGIAVQREGDRVSGCTAATKEAVREAARRAALANLPTIGEGGTEMVFVREK
jgi:hypothetical protein